MTPTSEPQREPTLEERERLDRKPDLDRSITAEVVIELTDEIWELAQLRHELRGHGDIESVLLDYVDFEFRFIGPDGEEIDAEN